jgi:rhodanese-related sulfurtransferase
MNKKYWLILCVLLVLFCNSCIEDNITPPLTGDLNPAAELLVYFESQGDFANNPDAPALVDVDEVYTNLDSYLIIDIRPAEEFQLGHIEGSINIKTDSLYDYFQDLNTLHYDKIIIVSRNGQSSAYFTCLLRLLGISNVFSMNFGLASWNDFFADEWLDAVGDDPNIRIYINDPAPKSDYMNLPDITFKDPNAQIEQNVRKRIKKIMLEGFTQGITFEREISQIGTLYIVCYGLGLLYYSPRYGPLSELGHNPDAVFYMSDPLFELRSVNYLQTLPTKDKVLIYDETGQMGASMTAYLRVLGYNATTLLFGGNQLIYSRMIYYPDILQFAFDNTDIKNYPYITGE